MELQRIEELSTVYRHGLLSDVVPYWMNHAVDVEHGGIFSCLDRDGSVFDTDKSIWIQGRFAWLLATLHSTVEPKSEWLDLARTTIEFIERHGYDSDGRMFFHVSQSGEPLRKRRYAYSEAFACMAHAAYAKVSGSDFSQSRALQLFRQFVDWNFTPGKMPAKHLPTRPSIGLGPRMIAIGMAQTLRDVCNEPEIETWIDRLIDEVRRWFVKPDMEAVMETVGPAGEVFDHIDGRTLCPGHAIECAWFILQESRFRGGDNELTRLGCQMLEYMWRRGWDQEFGGLFYFRDVFGKPVQEYWHDMKFWWPHNEAIIATLMAYQLTGDDKYANWHRQVHDWAYSHFPDPEFGEWFGYLHRDGRLSHAAKGTMWKGPFHLPRMLLICWKTLEEMRPGKSESYLPT